MTASGVIDTTIERFRQLFQSMQTRNPMLNAFYFAPPSDFHVEGAAVYPYFAVEPGRIDYIQGDQGIRGKQYTFDFYVVDKIDKGDANYINTSNDSAYILELLLADVQDQQYYIDQGCRIVNSPSSERIWEAGTDNTNGWKMTIQFEVPMVYTPCNSPMVPLTSFIQNGVALQYLDLQPQNLEQVLAQGNNAGIYQIDMNGNKIINVATGSNPLDAVNYGQLSAIAVSVDNGLTSNAGVIELGGELIKNTDIDGQFDLRFGGNTPLRQININSNVDIALRTAFGSAYSLMDAGNGYLLLQANGGSSYSSIYTISDNIQLISSNSTGVSTTTVDINPFNMFIGNSLSGFAGAKYTADFGVNFIDRSLIDKGYGDSHYLGLTAISSASLTQSYVGVGDSNNILNGSSALQFDGDTLYIEAGTPSSLGQIYLNVQNSSGYNEGGLGIEGDNNSIILGATAGNLSIWSDNGIVLSGNNGTDRQLIIEQSGAISTPGSFTVSGTVNLKSKVYLGELGVSSGIIYFANAVTQSYIGFRQQYDTSAVNQDYYLPLSQPNTDGQVLSSSIDGTMSWVTVSSYLNNYLPLIGGTMSGNIQFSSGVISDNNNVSSVDPINHRLLGPAGQNVVDYFSLQLNDLTTQSLNWKFRQLYDSTGQNSLFYGTRILYDASGNPLVDWSATQSMKYINDNSAGFTVRSIPDVGYLQANYLHVGSASSIVVNAPIYLTATGSIAIFQSTSTQSGYLSSTDWNTFNNKLGTVSGYVPYSGATNNLNLGSYSFSGTVSNSSGLISQWTNNLNYLTASSTVGVFVPYTGATGSVDLGSNSLTMSGTVSAHHMILSWESTAKPLLILQSGTLSATSSAGAIENNGTHLYWTAINGGARQQLDNQLPPAVNLFSYYDFI